MDVEENWLVVSWLCFHRTTLSLIEQRLMKMLIEGKSIKLSRVKIMIECVPIKRDSPPLHWKHVNSQKFK